MHFLKQILSASLFFLLANAALAQPTLTASEEVSRTGHFQLQWQFSDSETTFELQQANSADFAEPKTIYTGPEKARTMSGKLNGTYYFRVRAQDGEWSEPVQVQVAHYKLSTAFMFLGLGAVVFFATAVLIVGGHLRHRREHGTVNG